VSVPGEC